MRRSIATLLFVALSAPLAAQPAVQSRDGKLAIVAGEHGPRVIDNKGYSNPLLIPEEVDIQSLTALRAGWVAAGSQPVGDRRELYLRLLDAGGLKLLPTPRPQRGRIRSEPVVLAQDGGVVGMLWLEGEHREALQVFASPWLGITWGQPLRVSQGLEGGALALDATVLEDGSWLVTWAGFDGEDDEIYWSLVFGTGASTPVPLTDNSVPDILPTVTAVGRDAVLAWNQFDGEEYRVRIARMIDGRWDEGRTEPAGTFEPLLIDRGGVPTLLYFSYRDGKGSWELEELDTRGEVIRRSHSAAGGRDRPLIRPIDGDPHLEWPNGSDRQRVSWVDEE